MENTNVVLHPVWMHRRFRRLILYLCGGATFQAAWAVLCFALNYFHPLAKSQYLEASEAWTFSSLVLVYAMLSLTQAFYILITAFMSFFLTSRVWFYSGLVFSILPGLLPSLIQIPLALFLWFELRQPEWTDFFSRIDDIRITKRLTEQRRHRR